MMDQYDTKYVDKEIVKNEYVQNVSSYVLKAKKTAEEANLLIKKLNKNVLPRCQSADITSNIVKRDEVYIPRQMSKVSQPRFKEQMVVNNNDKNNEKQETILKLKSLFQEQYKNIGNSSKNVQKTSDKQRISNAYTLPKLSKHNVGVVNVINKVSEDKDKNNSKLNNLMVQRIPQVDLKPDLVLQKLATVQIKPDSKKTLCNYKPNVAYHEFKLLEPESRKCQPLNQPTKTNDEVVARSEIYSILYGMLHHMSSSDLVNDQLFGQLQKIMVKVEKSNSLECNDLDEVEDLIKEHSMVGLSDIVIKNRLLELAENYDDGISFDQLSVEIENSSHQVIKRLIKIKNSILSMKPSMELPNLSENNEPNDQVYADENSHQNVNFLSKNFDGNTTNEYVSVGEFLHQDSKYFPSSKSHKNENESVTKDSESTIIFCTEDHLFKNPIKFSSLSTQNSTNNKNYTSQLKENQHESKNENPNETKLLENFNISSIPSSTHSNVLLKNPLKSFGKECLDNNKNNYYKSSVCEDDCVNDKSSSINAGLNTINNETLLLTKCEANANSLKINTNVGHLSMDDNYEHCTPDLQEYHLNAPSFTSMSFNDNPRTDLRVQHLKKTEDTSISTVSSAMIPLKQCDQRVQSDTESLISFGEIPGLQKVNSYESLGEVLN